jgi:hypothetical protein
VTPRTIRIVVGVVFVGGIAAMIVASIADSNGGALTAGLITAVAALCLILTAALTGPNASDAGDGTATLRFDAAGAEALEERIAALVSEGADEKEVRDLVRDAVRLGRSASAATTEDDHT